jgi:PAS domain S-box-containing protein
VSLSPKKAAKRNPPLVSARDQGCWEFLDCQKVLCPAHGKKNLPCWFIPRTHCSDFVEEDYFDKLAACLICPFFAAQGDGDPSRWNHFIAEQLRQYNRKAMEQIYQKEGSFIEILNRIPDGLFTTDREFRISYFNPAAEKITGFSAYDAVGMYCKDVFKNPICEVDCALKQAVKGERNVNDRQYTITNAEGKEIPIICSTSVFLDPEGRITGGIEIFKDVTEQKRLQEEIGRREKKYRRIFEGSHDMIYVTNLDGTILDINQAGVEMLGYPNKKSLLSLGSARGLYRRVGDREKFLQLINQEGNVKDFEIDFKKRDGSAMHVLISSRRYLNHDSGDVEFEGIIKDITERKEAEEALRKRNVELSLLNKTAVTLNRTMDLNRILEETLSSVLKALRLKKGGVFLIDRERKGFLLQNRRGLPPQDPNFSDGVRFKDELLKQSLLEKAVKLTPKPAFPTFQVTYPSENKEKVPWLSCFLITAKGESLGFYGLYLPPGRELSPPESHLLGSLCNFLGGGLENIQLLKTVRRHRQELRRLTEKLFQSQEEERRRIARELHDEAGQALTAVKLGLDHLEEVDPDDKVKMKKEISEIRKMLVRTSSEIRRLSYRLHPTLLIDLGLRPALDLYLKEVTTHSKLNIDFRMVGFDRRLDPDLETVLYRFSQEALTNTLNHGQAKKFQLSIIKSYPKIIFLAEDDGIGFDGQISGKSKRSLGLLGMRERTSLMEGSFQIKSRPGEGTRIRIEIPLPEAHGISH